MTPEPFVATPDTALNELVLRMIQYDCGAIPIVTDLKKRRLTGIVTDRDIIARAVSQDLDPMRVTAGDVMSLDVKTISPDAPLEELYALFRRERFRRVPVVEDGDRIIGIVTLSDLALKLPYSERAEVDRTLREVVGAGSKPEPAGSER
jgi:CBS domain-containing protein